MALFVNTNITAIDAANNLNTTETGLEQSTQQLSSGLRINSAADDAAGLTISQNLQGQINGVDQANRNAQDGISLVQTAGGALTQVQQMLQRIRELAVQYGNGTLNATDRAAIVSEADQLISQIEQIGSTTQFNGISVLNSASSITFQVGANDGETISVATISLGAIADVSDAFSGGTSSTTYTEAQVLTANYNADIADGYDASDAQADTSDLQGLLDEDGLQYSFNGGSLTEAQIDADYTDFANGIPPLTPAFNTQLGEVSGGANISEIDAAINAVSGAASTFGAVENRLQYTMANLSTYEENLTSANSRIMDVDMATAMTNFTSQQVLQQAGTAMLSQAQKLPDTVLSLLQGV